jgi:hypothetical protein
MNNNIINFKQIWDKKCSKYNFFNKKQISILNPVKRIIVIGDIHGDYDLMINSLKIAKVIDDDNMWIGKDTVVLQVGDQIDRCRPNGINCNTFLTANDENDLKILAYFTILHTKALKHNGAVYSLMGNHELLNVQGNLNYVSFKSFDNFGNTHTNINDKINKRKKLFSPGNKISNFLACTRHVALIIGSNLFVHGGIIGQIAKKYGIKSINKIMTLYLLDEFKNKYIYDNEKQKFHKLTNTEIISNDKDSPLWNRLYGYIKYYYQKFSNDYDTLDKINKICSTNLDIIKETYKVDNIYVGHTPMFNGITSVCNNKVWLTDYAGSKAFKKSKHITIQVLEILNDGEQINILQ